MVYTYKVCEICGKHISYGFRTSKFNCLCQQCYMVESAGKLEVEEGEKLEEKIMKESLLDITDYKAKCQELIKENEKLKRGLIHVILKFTPDKE